MPALQGEVPLLTLFADIHYIFSPPHVKPPHHRFDKSSYVYLFHNPMQRRGRLEVANHAGTPEQDAFSGYLDSASVQRSHRHPTLFTITIDGARAQGGSAGSTPQSDPSQWHLPAADQHNQGRYNYKLHTVDLYFWTVDDSNLFLDSLRRVMHESQLRILDAPSNPNEPRNDTMSPVVQKLEQAAISNPYQGRNEHASQAQAFPGPPAAPQGQTQSFAGPPTVPQAQQQSFPGPPSAVPGQPQSFPGPPSAATPSSHHTASPPPAPQPMAYNPAAPAAPEKFAHREPTPPPADAETGTGLAAAAAHDAGHPYGAPPQQHPGAFPQHQQPSQQPYMPGPPQARQSSYGFSPPPNTTSPPAPGIQRTNTAGSFPPPPPQPQTFGAPPVQGHSPSPHAGTPQQQYAHAPPAQQYANYPQSPGHPPVQSPGFPPTPGHAPLASPGMPPQGYGQPLQSPGLPGQGQNYTHGHSPAPPVGGYSQYSYQNQSKPTFGQQQEAWRPTEAEHQKVTHGGGGQGTVGGQGEGGAVAQSNFGQKVGRLEKGVSGFLKRLDKKI